MKETDLANIGLRLRPYRFRTILLANHTTQILLRKGAR